MTHFRRSARAPNRGVLWVVARRDDDGLELVDGRQPVEQGTKQRRALNGRQRARLLSIPRRRCGNDDETFMRAASILDFVLN